MATGDWWHSYYDDRFSSGGFPTREAAVAEGLAAHDGRPFYVAQEQDTLSLVKRCADVADIIVETVDMRMSDYIGGDDALVELSKESQAALDGMIFEFLKTHATFSRCWLSPAEQIIPVPGNAT